MAHSRGSIPGSVRRPWNVFFLGLPRKFRLRRKFSKFLDLSKSTRNLPSIFPSDDVRQMTLPSLLNDISQTSSKRQLPFLYEFVYSIKKPSGKKLSNQFLCRKIIRINYFFKNNWNYFFIN